MHSERTGSQLARVKFFANRIHVALEQNWCHVQHIITDYDADDGDDDDGYCSTRSRSWCWCRTARNSDDRWKRACVVYVPPQRRNAVQTRAKSKNDNKQTWSRQARYNPSLCVELALVADSAMLFHSSHQSPVHSVLAILQPGTDRLCYLSSKTCFLYGCQRVLGGTVLSRGLLLAQRYLCEILNILYFWLESEYFEWVEAEMFGTFVYF